MSHLTTLVSRFLRTLENIKVWNRLERLEGERELRHHVASIIEYTFCFHTQQVNSGRREVEKLVRLLERGILVTTSPLSGI